MKNNQGQRIAGVFKSVFSFLGLNHVKKFRDAARARATSPVDGKLLPFSMPADHGPSF
ncbi:hypothetical protein [Chryseolinea serpens]|uniref:hypothetical protein n=1 Tax=Chryseolinea serpens TaxID=947013 RepID=UPI0015C11C47|nr:hypothetical protein [Chryseolinea serpens]